MQSVFEWHICTCISHCSSTSIPPKLFGFYFTPRYSVILRMRWNRTSVSELWLVNYECRLVQTSCSRPWVLNYHLSCFSPEEASCLRQGRSSRTPAILLSQPALIAEGMYAFGCQGVIFYLLKCLQVCQSQDDVFMLSWTSGARQSDRPSLNWSFSSLSCFIKKSS